MPGTLHTVSKAGSVSRGLLWSGSVFLLAVMFVSVWFVDQATRQGEAQELRYGLGLVGTAAALLDPAEIASLRGSPDDTELRSHELVTADLRAIREANPGFRFVYLMRPADHEHLRFMFLADAENPDSPDYSPPGQIYEGPSHDLRAAFSAGVPLLSDRVEDDWGAWISALAPIHHEGQTVAVLGMDIAHQDWMLATHRYRRSATIISGLVLTLIALFLVGIELQRRAGQRQAVLGRQLAERLQELEDVHEGLRLADVVVRHTSEAIVILDPEFRVLHVNPAYERLSGRSADDVLGTLPPTLAEDPALMKRVSAAIAAGDHWQEEVWALRPDGTRYPVGALAEVVRNAAGEIEQFIVVLQDLSAQKELEIRLRELSATDGLTGIANRRTFDDWLAREWQRAAKQCIPLSLVMADIDYFKRYNDRYGHVAGDTCLQQVAKTLKSGVRHDGDLVARYGGEEFVILLPGATSEAARAVAEALRASIESLALPHAGNPDAGVLTVSLGVATMRPTHDVKPTTLVELADKQLYRAKETGRNRVEAWEPGE